MTRQEFIDSILTWPLLLDFCREYDCYVCDNVYHHDELRELIADDFSNYSHEYHWTDIRDWLNDIDNNCSYYYRDGSFDYTSVDGYFDDYKADVLAWCDENPAVFDEADDDIPDGDMSMEDALAFLMDNMPYKITE